MEPTGRETAGGPVAAVGRITFDGNGNNSSVQNISRNGTYTFDVEMVGTYEVAEDCTGNSLTPWVTKFLGSSL